MNGTSGGLRTSVFGTAIDGADGWGGYGAVAGQKATCCHMQVRGCERWYGRGCILWCLGVMDWWARCSCLGFLGPYLGTCTVFQTRCIYAILTQYENTVLRQSIKKRPVWRTRQPPTSTQHIRPVRYFSGYQSAYFCIDVIRNRLRWHASLLWNTVLGMFITTSSSSNRKSGGS